MPTTTADCDTAARLQSEFGVTDTPLSWIESTITNMPMIRNFTSPSSNHLETTSKASSHAPSAQPSTMNLEERPSPEPRQIGDLFLWYGTEVVKNAATIICDCDSCRLPIKLMTLGVTFYAALTFEDYVNHVVNACNFHMLGLRHIRRSISRHFANTMAACILPLVWTIVMHCYMVPLRSRSTSYRWSRTSLLESSAT